MAGLFKPGGTNPNAGHGRGRGFHGISEAEIADRDPYGRHAQAPRKISRRGWWLVLQRVWQQNNEDNLGVVAAGCAFYTLLAIFPAMTAFVAIYGLWFNPADVERQLETVASLLPPAAFSLLNDRLTALTSTGNFKLGWGAALGLIIALYSATAGTKSLFAALNIVYDEREKRSFIAFNLQSIVFTLGSILGLVIALALVVVLPAVLNFLGFGGGTDLVLRLVRWPLLAGLVMLSLSLLYRFGPSRRGARWQWINPGAILGTLLWLLASAGFSFYVTSFASYDKTYGSLGAVVVLMLWLWVSAYAVLLGGELNSELELQVVKDTTIGPDRPMGRRGAYAADNVADVPKS